MEGRYPEMLPVAPDVETAWDEWSYERVWVDMLWTLRATTDNRIEPLAVGERQWQEDDASIIIEVARREGEEILLAVGI